MCQVGLRLGVSIHHRHYAWAATNILAAKGVVGIADDGFSDSVYTLGIPQLGVLVLLEGALCPSLIPGSLLV
jgi:hypothetical protein